MEYLADDVSRGAVDPEQRGWKRAADSAAGRREGLDRVHAEADAAHLRE